MAKRLLYGENARATLQAGVTKLADAVRSTLGPRGKAVVFERGTTIFSLDGVTILKQIFLKDKVENMGAQLVRNIADKTDQEAGDGTTTATLLADSILRQGLKALSAGIDHTRMKKGIDEGLKIAREFVEKIAKPIKANKEISDVATISSRDREIGDMVASIIKDLGEDAIITAEEGKEIGLHREDVEGLELDKGFIAPHFMTNLERGEAVIENANILLTSQVVSANQDIVPILERLFVSDKEKNLLVIAEDMKGEALATLVINKMQGRLLGVAVKTPGIGDNKMDQLEDIAAVTGAKVIAEQTGGKMEDVRVEDLGSADRVIITRDKTIIVGGKGKKVAIRNRIAYVKKSIETESSEYERELKEKRYAKLRGGIAIIKAGTISAEENMEMRYRIEDAVRSAQSSLEEGIVPGGGMALWHAAKKIEEQMVEERNLSYRTGLEIIAKAIREPARQVVKNAGENADVILSQTSEKKGYNSATGEFQDLVANGVIDPAKVVRVALENAVSIASMFLITEAVVTEDEEKKEEKDGKEETSN